MMLGGEREGEGMKTMIFMGGTQGNSSDEEILHGMQGRFEDGELDPDTGFGKGRLYDNKKSIHKTTQIDVTYH